MGCGPSLQMTVVRRDQVNMGSPLLALVQRSEKLRRENCEPARKSVRIGMNSTEVRTGIVHAVYFI
jgi:hypothetical protein